MQFFKVHQLTQTKANQYANCYNALTSNCGFAVQQHNTKKKSNCECFLAGFIVTEITLITIWDLLMMVRRSSFTIFRIQMEYFPSSFYGAHFQFVAKIMQLITTVFAHFSSQNSIRYRN